MYMSDKDMFDYGVPLVTQLSRREDERLRGQIGQEETEESRRIGREERERIDLAMDEYFGRYNILWDRSTDQQVGNLVHNNEPAHRREILHEQSREFLEGIEKNERHIQELERENDVGLINALMDERIWESENLFHERERIHALARRNEELRHMSYLAEQALLRLRQERELEDEEYEEEEYDEEEEEYEEEEEEERRMTRYHQVRRVHSQGPRNIKR